MGDNSTRNILLSEGPLFHNESAIAVIGDNSTRNILVSEGPSECHQDLTLIENRPTPETNIPVRPAEEETMSIPEGMTLPNTPMQLDENLHRTTESSLRRRGAPVRRRLLQESPRGSAARRRLLQRSPPSQRRSQLVSLTERFIVIEERRAEAELVTARARAEAELVTARAQETNAQCQQAIAQAISSLANSFAEYSRSINSHLSKE